MKNIILFFSIFFFSLSLHSQEIITFYASDSLPVTASFYEQDASAPYMVLLHQAGYSRGEYK